MLTPMDIHNKEFKRGFRGYSEEDVDAFMNNIAGDYEKVIPGILRIEGTLRQPAG